MSKTQPDLTRDTPNPAPTHTGGKDTGSCLVKVKCSDAAHAIRDEGQHVTVGKGKGTEWARDAEARRREHMGIPEVRVIGCGLTSRLP